MACGPAIIAVIALTVVVGATEAARILVMPIPHHSHVKIYVHQGRALAKDGHEVWILTSETHRHAINTDELNPLIFPVREEAQFELFFTELMKETPTGDGVGDLLSEMNEGIGPKYCEDMMENAELMTAIQELHFDLVVMDAVSLLSCVYMIPYKFDIPFLSMFGFQTVPWVVGVPGMPSVEPEIETAFTNKMNFWQRLENLQTWMLYVNNDHSVLHSERLMRKYMPANKPLISFDDIMRRSEIFLLNFEILCLDYPRVSAPNYQFIGGSTSEPAKKLSPDIDTFVQGAEHGIIVMTLGTLEGCQQIWQLLREKLFAAFERLPQRVIIQYRFPDRTPPPANVLLLDWVPQNDLLGHPRTRLFITHGGNNGANEAVFHGVPMLVIPIFYDQVYSAVRVEDHGYGKWVKDKKAVTTDELYELMNEIVNNRTYKNNIMKCSAIIRSMPSAREKFVFWVNHILKFGGDHLRPVDIPLYQVLMLDVIAFLLVVGLAIFLTCACFMCFLYKFFIRSKVDKLKVA